MKKIFILFFSLLLATIALMVQIGDIVTIK